MTNDFSSPEPERANFSELLDLPESLQPIVRWLRQQSAITLADLIAHVGDEAQATQALETLLARGLLQRLPSEAPETPPQYRLRLKGRRTALKKPEIWQTLVEDEHE